MRLRINGMKEAMRIELFKRMPDKDYSYLEKSQGMFFFSGLSKAQIDTLLSEYGIYMTQDGRMNIAGLNEESLERVADAMCEVMKS